jgi:DNA-binding NtrC family response regulator
MSRAQNCYQLAKFGEEIGHRLSYCPTECNDCAFYRARRGLATTVLVVTRDEALSRKLRTGIDLEPESLHFVESSYECSSAIGSVRPAVVVLDSALPEVLEGHLVEAVNQDDRIPGAVVSVACRDGDEAAVNRLNAPAIAAPFTAGQLERLVVGVARSAARSSLDMA